MANQHGPQAAWYVSYVGNRCWVVSARLLSIGERCVYSVCRYSGLFAGGWFCSTGRCSLLLVLLSYLFICCMSVGNQLWLSVLGSVVRQLLMSALHSANQTY